MIIDDLPWDTSFFEIKVGKIKLETGQSWDLDEILKVGKGQGFDLIYGFCDRSQDQTMNTNVRLHKDCYVTTNIVYGKKTDEQNYSVDQNIRTANESSDLDVLIKLGIEAGHSSRFKIDSRLPNGSFEKLYKIWVSNSLDKIIADEVFVYDEGAGVLGMVTIKINDSSGTIGLIAVDAMVRGKRIGAKLVDAGCKLCQSYGLKQIRVGTQLENVGANNFYKQQGFEPLSQTEIYHFWI